MSTIDDLRTLGYHVGEAFTPDGTTIPVFGVSGFGLSTYVSGNDQEQIDSLADPVLHAERIAPPAPRPPAVSAIDELRTITTTLTALEALPVTAKLTDVIAALKTAFGG